MYAAIHVPGLDASQRAALVECAEGFSPQVEATAADTVLADVGGLEKLTGAPDRIARSLAEAARRKGLEASVAIASNCDAAVAAARGFSGITVIPAGDEARVLSPLPLALLSPEAALAETLDRWGVRTFGQMAELPDLGVAARLGEEGVRLQRLARGENRRPLVPSEAPEVYEDSLDLDHPLELLEPLLFLLARLVNSLCGRLESHGLATNALHLRLGLENGAGHAVDIRLPFPMRETKTFLKLLELELDAAPLPAAIVALALKLEPADPRVVQRGLFIPQAPEPEKLELTLARIASLVGRENVGAAELLDTHRPGAFRMRRGLGPGGGARGGTPRLALRLFRPPLAARVEAPVGHPERVEARGVRGVGARFAGPWRTSGDWWCADAWDRDEWDIAFRDGSLYLIYQDRRTGGWFVEGNYD